VWKRVDNKTSRAMCHDRDSYRKLGRRQIVSIASTCRTHQTSRLPVEPTGTDPRRSSHALLPPHTSPSHTAVTWAFSLFAAPRSWSNRTQRTRARMPRTRKTPLIERPGLDPGLTHQGSYARRGLNS